MNKHHIHCGTLQWIHGAANGTSFNKACTLVAVDTPVPEVVLVLVLVALVLVVLVVVLVRYVEGTLGA